MSADAEARRSSLPAVLLAVFCTIAFVAAILATRDATWPTEEDPFRDMASAQSILHGRYGEDPSYLGEKLWYNPLVPALVALITRVTGAPLHLVMTRAGPYLNLLAPLAFFLLLATLFDRWVAIAATTCYLFLGVLSAPSFAYATYSPWLWPTNFAQAVFYLTLAAYTRSIATRSWRWAALTGALLGLSFLAHSAAALMGGLVIGMLLLSQLIAQREHGARRTTLSRFALLAFVALLVSLPLLVSIVGHYHLKVRNAVPNSFNPFTIPKVRAANLLHYRSVRTLVLIAGLIALLIERHRAAPQSPDRSSRNLILAWLSAALILFVWAWRGVLVPTVHFALYFRAAEAVLFGLGMVYLAGWLGRLLGRLRLSPSLPFASFATCATLVAWVALTLPAYLQSLDLTLLADWARFNSGERATIALYDWIASHTRIDDVFVTDGWKKDPKGEFKHISLESMITAAGRKLVCHEAHFSNPFVDLDARHRDSDRLFDLLAKGERGPEVLALAAKYRVRYAVQRDKAIKVSAPPSTLLRVFGSESIQVFELRLPQAPAPRDPQ